MTNEEAENRIEALELAVSVLLQEISTIKEKIKDVPRTNDQSRLGHLSRYQDS
jgi:hypothetical protein